MSNNPLNVALIGCGRIAGHHCKAIADVEGVELAAVCDLEIEKADAYAVEHGVPAYASYRDMFAEHPDIDIAAVITPSGPWPNTEACRQSSIRPGPLGWKRC